jgi:hypothetical protein
MDPINDRITRQLNEALERWDHVRAGDADQQDVIEAHTLLAAAIDAIAPRDSQFRRRADIALQDEYNIKWQAEQLAGVVAALRTACWGGYLDTVTSLVRADLFSDFIAMSEHLLENGYKDPAAVLGGGVLEEHLRKLCVRAGIATDHDGRPKPASRMNDELTGSGTYTQLDAKSVTAWLDLRNRAAHGKFLEYSPEQVELMLHGIRHFVARTLA